MSRVIKDIYWDKLTRSVDINSLLSFLKDEKVKTEQLYIYIPESDKYAVQYYTALSSQYNCIKIQIVPKNFSSKNIKNIYKNPGILSLSFDKKTGKSNPYVVPGGRFNEMYGWDSYFIGIGLLVDDKFNLAKAMIENLEYQIIHYGKILNANRSYYLTRSQPPFFTSFIKEFYEKYRNSLSKEWLFKKITTAIKEYHNVWMKQGVRLTSLGLNRYFGEGKGIAQETEKEHFKYYISKYAKKHCLTPQEFKKAYMFGEIKEPELDTYFIHDRSMRESGHDTTSRLDNCAANLIVVDLNCLLYKYETDFAHIIKNYFMDSFVYNNETLTESYWLKKAQKRKKLIYRYLWHRTNETFYDYNLKEEAAHLYLSATNLYPLWSNLCTQEEAQKLVTNQLELLICKGGVASTSEITNSEVDKNAPKRQWDFPYGWAPHQMLIWQGLLNYGFHKKAQELIYRWLWLIVKTAVNYNGTIPEKFDVKNCTHKIDIEYGNVGVDFKWLTDGGFGWTNASFKLGMKLLEDKYICFLNKLVDPDQVFKNRTN
ncbi:MAG: trehalase family glycosidase [Tenacibaculum sp.]